MKHAIIAIEDKRFYTNDGVDLRGIGRALYQDVRRPEGGPGRLDDRPAVRQERARRPGPPDAVREAARGRAGLPPHAPVVQAARSCATTSTRSTSATAPTASSRPRAPTSAASTRAASATARAPCAAQLEPARGGADRRRGRLPERLRPDRPPGRRQARRDLVLRAHARAAAASRASSTTPRSPSRCRPRRDVRPPQEDPQVRLLHLVDPPAGGRQARRRPGRRASGVRGWADDQDDARRQAPGRRPARHPGSGLPWTGRAARVDGGARQPRRRGPRDGRRRRLCGQAVQPGHAGPTPAGLGVQAVRARRGAQGGH